MDAVDATGPRAECHSLEVTRTARVCTLSGTGEVTDFWVACHGYRQLAERFIRRFTPIFAPARTVVAPEGLSRFYINSDGGRHGKESRVGATWMTREDRENEIADYIRYLDAVARSFGPPHAEATRRTAFGFSQGVHTAARWAMLGATPIDRLILWGAYLPPDLDLERVAERWQAMKVIQVYGDADGTRSVALEDQQAERLEAAGLTLERRTYEGGHHIDPALLAALASEGSD